MCQRVGTRATDTHHDGGDNRHARPPVPAPETQKPPLDGAGLSLVDWIVHRSTVGLSAGVWVPAHLKWTRPPAPVGYIPCSSSSWTPRLRRSRRRSPP